MPALTSIHRFFLVSIMILLCIANSLAQTNQIDEVKVLGCHRLSQKFVEDFIDISDGDLIDMVEVNKSLTRLKRLPAVAHAYVKEDRMNENVVLTYFIEERITIIPTINVFTARDDELPIFWD